MMERDQPPTAAAIARLPPQERKTFLANMKRGALDALTPAERAGRAEDARAFGNEHFRAQRWAEAAVEYQTSVDLHATSTAGSNLAATLLKMGEFHAALDAAEAALALPVTESVRAKLIRRRDLALKGVAEEARQLRQATLAASDEPAGELPSTADMPSITCAGGGQAGPSAEWQRRELLLQQQDLDATPSLRPEGYLRDDTGWHPPGLRGPLDPTCPMGIRLDTDHEPEPQSTPEPAAAEPVLAGSSGADAGPAVSPTDHDASSKWAETQRIFAEQVAAHESATASELFVPSLYESSSTEEEICGPPCTWTAQELRERMFDETDYALNGCSGPLMRAFEVNDLDPAKLTAMTSAELRMLLYKEEYGLGALECQRAAEHLIGAHALTIADPSMERCCRRAGGARDCPCDVKLREMCEFDDDDFSGYVQSMWQYHVNEYQVKLDQQEAGKRTPGHVVVLQQLSATKYNGARGIVLEAVEATGRIKVHLMGGIAGPKGASSISVLPAKIFVDWLFTVAALQVRAPRRGYAHSPVVLAASQGNPRLIKAMLQCGAHPMECSYWKEEQEKMGGAERLFCAAKMLFVENCHLICLDRLGTIIRKTENRKRFPQAIQKSGTGTGTRPCIK